MYELHIIDGPVKGNRFTVDVTSVFIGRSKRNDVQIRDGSVSGRHAKVTGNNGTFLLEDLKSLNGTFINGTRISPGAVTSFDAGDQIRLGLTVFTLERLGRDDDQGLHRSQTDRWAGNERRRNERKDVAFIIGIAQLLAGKTLGIQETLDQVLDRLLSFLGGFDRAFVFIYLPDQDVIKTVALRSKQEEHDTTVQYSRPMVEQAIHQGRTITLNPVDTEATQDLGNLGADQILSVVCAPLFKGSKPRGALYMDALRALYDLQRRDMVILESICDLLSSYFQKLEF
jgi:hypothetical protein